MRECIECAKHIEVIKRLQAELSNLKETYDALHLDFIGRGDEIKRLKERNKSIAGIFYSLAKDHYWDSFENDKEVVLKHIESLLDKTEQALKESEVKDELL